MPELPEVETVRRGLLARARGQAHRQLDQNRKDLRFPLPENFAARVRGRKIERLERRAKYLLAHLSGGDVLLMHLGMTGRFTVHVTEIGSTARVGKYVHEASADGSTTTSCFTWSRARPSHTTMRAALASCC